MELGEHLDAFFHSHLLKIEWRWHFGHWPSKKQVLYRHAWSFKAKNYYKSLLRPYEG
jgi:hypothetical protein